jgi:hypothetical protein
MYIRVFGPACKKVWRGPIVVETNIENLYTIDDLSTKQRSLN